MLEFKSDLIEETLHVYSITNLRRNMEHPWLPMSKNKKGLKAKKVQKFYYVYYEFIKLYLLELYLKDV